MNATKRFSVAAVITVLALLGATLFAGVADAKKKKSKSFTSTKAVNLPLPEATGAGPTLRWGFLPVTFSVPKKFKKSTVSADSVEVTFQTSGVTADAADDVTVRVMDPKGLTAGAGMGFGGTSIGPATATPNSGAGICGSTTGCEDPQDSLLPPYLNARYSAPDLTRFNGRKMAGTWTVWFLDTSAMGAKTSIVNSAGLKIKPNSD